MPDVSNALAGAVDAAQSAAAPPTIVEGIDYRIRVSPDEIFVTGLDGTPVTYATADTLSRAVAEELVQEGESAGGRIGLFLPNAPAWVVASLGVWRSGRSIVACGTLLSAAEASRAFHLAGTTTVITTEPDVLNGLGLTIIEVDESGAICQPRSRDADAQHEPANPTPDSEAVVFFTSGTTGTPKGVPHTHGDLIRWARQVAGAYARDSGFWPTTAPRHVAPGVIFTPFGHIGGYLSLAFRVWIGRTSLLVPKFSPEAVARLLSKYQFDALQLTPTMVHMLAHTELDVDMREIRYVTSSTAPLTDETRKAFETRYGLPVLQAYGLTEVGTVASERFDDVIAGLRQPNSVGRIADGVRVRIVDMRGNDVADDVDGEIVVSSATVAPYLQQDETPMDGWFHTGDIGRRDADGFLYITGRLSDRIIVGGFNVYPADVEAVLVQSEFVSAACVVGVEDPRLGELPVAAVVWTGEPRADELREFARERLAHYKVPREWLPVSTILLTNRGKVDRKRMAEDLRQRMKQ
jgi:acyl-CoA synthetase (AMP-forming)/AMP-acid ligase II